MITIKQLLDFIKQHNLPLDTELAIQPDEFCSNYSECVDVAVIKENGKTYLAFTGGNAL